MYDLLEELAGKSHFYPPVNWLRENKIRGQLNYLLERLAEARSRSNSSRETRPIAVRVLYATKIPCLILDKSVSECVPLESAKEENNNISLDSIKSSSRTSSK